MKGARTAILWLAGVVLGGVFLWLALRAIDLHAVLSILSRTSPLDVLGIVGCAVAFVGLKALRWAYLIRHLQPVSPRYLIDPTLAGIAVNYGVPHSGELVRTWMVAQRENLPKASLLASIAVERLFDFCATLLLGLVALLAGHAVADTLGSYLWALLLFIGIALAAALPFLFWPRRSLDVSRSMLKPLPTPACKWILRHLQHGIEGLGSLQQASTALKVLGLSVMQWGLMAGCIWLSLRAVGIAPEPAVALVILLLLVVALILPTAPGQVGTTQIAFLLGATPFGLDQEAVIAGSLLYNVFVPVPLIIAAVGILLAQGACKRLVRHRVPGPFTVRRLSRRG